MSDAVRYLLLPRMVVKDFNAESNQYVAGIPAMTAFTGYGHMLERKMQASGWHFKADGVAVMLHDLHLHPGHPKCPAAMHGVKEKEKFINPPIIEEIKGDMRVTLLLRLVWDKTDREAKRWVKQEFDNFQWEDLQCVRDWIAALPCCGGSCHAVGRITTTDGDDDEVAIVKHLRRTHQIDTGYFIQPRNDLLAQAQADGQDALDALLDTQRRTQNADGKWLRDQTGHWLIPLAVGYQAIETPQTRAGTRKNASHVYAEPLTGLGELVHAGKPLWQPYFDFETVCWVHKHDPAHHTYYVTTLKENTYG